MNDLANIIQRFWTLTEERIPVAQDAIAAMRAGKPKSVFALKDVVHGIKGESQLLRLRSCATLMTGADRLTSQLIDLPHEPQALDALEHAIKGLSALVTTRGDAKAAKVDVAKLVLELEAAVGDAT